MALNDVLQELIDEGRLIPVDDSKKVRNWIDDCMMVIEVNYECGKNGSFPKERIAFNGVGSVSQGIKLLKSLMVDIKQVEQISPVTINVNQTQSQISTSIAQNQLSLQINLNIDNSIELTNEQKQAAKELYHEVETEVQKDKPNWLKVKDLLKNSLEYGLKIAPDIIRMAEAYYKAKL